MMISRPALQAAGLALLLMSPVAALAQAAPDAPPPAPAGAPADVAAPSAPSATQQAAMQAERLQSERIRQQARTQILGELTPQHRAQVATIVGQLGIAAVPDPRAAAREIDSLLSAREARAVLTTAAGERDAERALRESARAQFEASLTPAERERMQARMQQMKVMHASRPAPPAPDAGMIVLHTALGGGGMYHDMHGGPPGAR